MASKVMSAIKSKNTKPELLLRKALYKSGLKGYRLHYKKIPGRPDIAFVSKKIAVFVNGCYWHRCPYCKQHIPKSNSDFWEKKFKRNVERDEEKRLQLIQKEWQVIVIWECQISNKLNYCLKEVITALERTRNLNDNY